jgi:hypothetical protein
VPGISWRKMKVNSSSLYAIWMRLLYTGSRFWGIWTEISLWVRGSPSFSSGRPGSSPGS